MDTSAFEADDEADLNLTELYHSLPEDVQHTIAATLFIARSFAKVGLLIAVVACCALAFCLLIVWVCLHTLLIYLLIYLSTILHVAFEGPHDPTANANGGRSPSTELIGSGEAKDNPKQVPSTTDPHTSVDLDLFEAFLNSPRDTAHHDTQVQAETHQSVQHSVRTPEHNEQEPSLLWVKEDLLVTPTCAKDNSVGGYEALEKAESPSSQRKAESDENIHTQLSFEPALAGTAEQLKEAANLQADFTKARSPARGPNKHVSRPGNSRQDLGAISAVSTKPASGPRSYVGFVGKSHSNIPMLRQNVENIERSKIQESKHAVLNKPSTLPPHLRSQTNRQKREENERPLQNQDIGATVVTKERDLDNHQAAKRAPSDSFESRQPQEKVNTPQDIENRDDTNKEIPVTRLAKPLSFAEALNMGQHDHLQKLTNVVGQGSTRVAVRDRPHESVQPIAKPADRAMSVVQLKTLNNAPKTTDNVHAHLSQIAVSDSELEVRLSQLAADDARRIDPGTLRIIQTLARLGLAQVRDENYQAVYQSEALKSELRNRAPKIAKLKSQLSMENVQLAKEMWRRNPQLATSDPVPSVNAVPDVLIAKDAHETASLNVGQERLINSPQVTIDPNPSRSPANLDQSTLCSKQLTSNPSSPKSTAKDRNAGDRESRSETSEYATTEVFTNDVATAWPLGLSVQSKKEKVDFATSKLHAGCSPTSLGTSAIESPMRSNALRQVVQVINKQVFSEPQSFESHPVEHTPDSLNTRDETACAKLASDDSQCSSNPRKERSNSNNGASPSSMQPPGVRLPQSLSPQAPTFLPYAKPKGSQDNTVTKRSMLRASSNAFVPIANGSGMTQSPAGTNGLSLGDDFITSYATDFTVYHPYSMSRIEDTDYGNSFARQIVLPASQLGSRIGNASFQEAEAYQLRQLTKAAWAKVKALDSDDTTSKHGPEPMKQLSLTRLPDAIPTDISTRQTASDQSVTALESVGITNSAVDNLSSPPGPTTASGASQHPPGKPRVDFDLDNGSRSTKSNQVAGCTEPALKNNELESGLKGAIPQIVQGRSQTTIDPISALDFLGIVRSRLGNHSAVYNGFLDTMRDQAGGIINYRDTTARVEKLFEGHPDLIQSFHAFQPSNLSTKSAALGSDITKGPVSDALESEATCSDDQRTESNSSEEQGGDANHSAESEEQADSASDKQQSANTIKKKRQKARNALREAATERETIRKRLAGTWTLEGLKSLEDATKTYMLRRSELAHCMASGELNVEDEVAFPVLRKDDQSAPKKGQITNQGSSGVKKDKKTDPPSEAENETPLLLVHQAALDSRLKEAVEARDKYQEAHAYLSRPPPPNRGNVHDARKKPEARIELASKRYQKKIDAVKELFPDGELPPEIAEVLEVYDEEEEKELRDLSFAGVTAADPTVSKRKWSSRRGHCVWKPRKSA